MKNQDKTYYHSILQQLALIIIQNGGITSARDYVDSPSSPLQSYKENQLLLESINQNKQIELPDLSNVAYSEYFFENHPRFAIKKHGDEDLLDAKYKEIYNQKKNKFLESIKNHKDKTKLEGMVTVTDGNYWYSFQKLKKLSDIVSDPKSYNSESLEKLLSVETEYNMFKELSGIISKDPTIEKMNEAYEKYKISENPKYDSITKKKDLDDDLKDIIWQGFRSSIINISHTKNVANKEALKTEYQDVQLKLFDLSTKGIDIDDNDLKKLKELFSKISMRGNDDELLKEIEILETIKEGLSLNDKFIPREIMNLFPAYTDPITKKEYSSEEALDKFKDDLNKYISDLENDKSKKDMNDIKIRAGKLVLGLLAISVTSLLVAFLAPKLIAAASIALIVTGAISGGAAISTGVYSYMRYNEISTKQSDNLGPDREMIVENSSRPSRSTTLDVEGLSGTVVRQSDTRNPLSGSEYNKASSSEGEQPRVDQGPGGGRI